MEQLNLSKSQKKKKPYYLAYAVILQSLSSHCKIKKTTSAFQLFVAK